MSMDLMSVAAIVAILVFIYKIVEVRTKGKNDKAEEKRR